MTMVPLFDRNSLKIQSLEKRDHDLDLQTIRSLEESASPDLKKQFRPVAEDIVQARKHKRSIILMMGGHVIRSGVQHYLIDLMRRGYIGGLAMNGAGIIHDYELSLIGATTESVARYIKNGEFGLWQETGKLNDIINQSYADDPKTGMGEAIGRAIHEGDYPHKDISLFAAGYELKIPITVHVGIGYDIIHEHPNCDGAATGALSYNDFLKFTSLIQNLEKGVVMSFGSAVMAPEIYLKALSMARNVAHQKGSVIRHFTTLVCDLHDLPTDFSKEPSKDNTGYYYRPWKTMLVRTVADGGKSYYIQAQHADSIPALWTIINEIEENR
ncbi:MAG: hypothetical protein O3A78_13830 [Nitrospinae bacterium]|nr:hypothetical protein [Nitrospinota bacterium]